MAQRSRGMESGISHGIWNSRSLMTATLTPRPRRLNTATTPTLTATAQSHAPPLSQPPHKTLPSTPAPPPATLMRGCRCPPSCVHAYAYACPLLMRACLCPPSCTRAYARTRACVPAPHATARPKPQPTSLVLRILTVVPGAVSTLFARVSETCIASGSAKHGQQTLYRIHASNLCSASLGRFRACSGQGSGQGDITSGEGGEGGRHSTVLMQAQN
eukprot:364726-Chlamydomonas_euryale.AAC.9